jgi:hypothetical protein
MTEPKIFVPSPNDALAGRPPVSETIKHLAYAEAALMLLEGLLQLCVARRLLTAEEIVSTVESVIATKQQMIIDGEHPEISLVAAGVLSTLANSVAAMDVATMHAASDIAFGNR